jgi:hypothetical protein
MRCKICEEEYNLGCLCGYCHKCLDRFNHRECEKIEKSKIFKKVERNKK